MSSRWPRILMYHSIARLENDPNMLCTPPERFEAHMKYLRWRNLRGVSIRELLRAMSLGDAGRLIGLTFDDAYEDFLQVTIPILEKMNFSATVFAVGSKLGGENDWAHSYEPRPRMKLLGPKGLREVSQRGMEVGSHTMSHARLTGIESRLLEHEVSRSRHVLSEVLDEEIEGFCYPYGSLDPAAVEAARRAGYVYACAWKTHVEQGVHDLPRIPMSGKDNLLRFAAKLEIYARYAKLNR